MPIGYLFALRGIWSENKKGEGVTIRRRAEGKLVRVGKAHRLCLVLVHAGMKRVNFV